jgi:glycosyltransferase involved in cell wall biosynthesis
MLGQHPDYKIVAAPAGISKFFTPLGSYITTFSKPVSPCGAIDYNRKIAHTMPDQTVSCCMIVKDAEQDLLRCLRSVAPFVQEFIIGIDSNTSDKTMNILCDFMDANPLVAFKTMDIPPATETGFAAARNATIREASGDWILWIDSDEILVNGELMGRYLRNSIVNGYAVNQHHFSHAPVGVVKVDLPCRLFRNHIGVKFFGAVHEHPEIVMNEGLGPVSMASGMNIVHHGYMSDEVRKKRFYRNLPLLKRDREELPDRILGKFLWLRDLAQACMYDMEDNRGDEAIFNARVEEGLALWKDLLASKNYRIILDSLPYYSQLAMAKGDGVDFSFNLDASITGKSKINGHPAIEGYFTSKEDALELMNALAIDKIGDLDRRYL